MIDLLIHTDRDHAIPASESEALARAGHGDRTQLWMVPGTAHVGARAVARAVARAAYDKRVIEFFRESLSHLVIVVQVHPSQVTDMS